VKQACSAEAAPLDRSGVGAPAIRYRFGSGRAESFVVKQEWANAPIGRSACCMRPTDVGAGPTSSRIECSGFEWEIQERRLGMFRFLHACVVAFGAGLVSGCASAPPPPTMRWTGNNHATQEQWLNDRTTCYNETQQRISDGSLDQAGAKANSVDGPMCRAFNGCLAARGYVRSDATGTLTLPEGASVPCAAPGT